jgi:hypothetical protein
MISKTLLHRKLKIEQNINVLFLVSQIFKIWIETTGLIELKLPKEIPDFVPIQHGCNTTGHSWRWDPIEKK